MPGRYSCPRTCRLCGADYTVLGNASHAGHRMGICGRCATARARDTNDRKASVPDVTMPRLPGALCAGQDPELWQSDDPEAVEYARSECAACPVRDACLAYALAAGITHGMWGGLTERERERLPRGRLAPRPGGIVTAPLPIPQPCGCPVGEGHRCPPPWVDEWPEPVAADRETRLDQVGCEAAPAGASTPDEGLTTNLSDQEGART